MRNRYNNTMKRLDFKVTFQNVQGLLADPKEMKRRQPRLILQYLPTETNQARTDEFRALWEPLIDKQAGDYLNVADIAQLWRRASLQRMGRRSLSVCYFPWTSMSVLWDGRVVTCCMDSNGVQVIGDLNSHTVKEVWDGAGVDRVRDDFRKFQYDAYPVCRSCDWVRRR